MLRWARKQYGRGIGLAVACMAWGEEEPVILLPRRCYDWLLLLLERLKEGREGEKGVKMVIMPKTKRR